MFDGIDMAIQPFFIGREGWPIWAERLSPHVEKMAAGSGGRFLACDIQECLAHGRMQMWVVLDGSEIACAMLTELIVYPRAKALRCIGIVGHRPKRWMHLLALVEESGRLNFGCDRLEAMHPAGYERLLKTGGWKVFHLLSEKAL